MNEGGDRARDSGLVEMDLAAADITSVLWDALCERQPDRLEGPARRRFLDVRRLQIEGVGSCRHLQVDGVRQPAPQSVDQCLNAADLDGPLAALVADAREIDFVVDDQDLFVGEGGVVPQQDGVQVLKVLGCFFATKISLSFCCHWLSGPIFPAELNTRI